MKLISFVFSYVPHGTSFGREGLDAILGTSLIMTKINVFFIGDGVFQLIKNHKTKNILARNYVSSFPILSLYNITNFYCCKKSLQERGLKYHIDFILKIKILELDILRVKLENCDCIINF
ncbi:sulfurtransferase complex subunit TusC [Buchnera aphidicola]|uniref:sulfurtransferase complex subunit TusC n=1 Tax=Buchnera aphidicola TaxID=9 RepID=UPI003BEF18D0